MGVVSGAGAMRRLPVPLTFLFDRNRRVERRVLSCSVDHAAASTAHRGSISRSTTIEPVVVAEFRQLQD
jgi:hypothetical protein